jgi:hypothetical protein
MPVPTTVPAAVNLALQRCVIAVRTSGSDVDLKLLECRLCASDVTAAAPPGKALEDRSAPGEATGAVAVGDVDAGL